MSSQNSHPWVTARRKGKQAKLDQTPSIATPSIAPITPPQIPPPAIPSTDPHILFIYSLIQQLGGDILALQQKVSYLEAENASLKGQLANKATGVDSTRIQELEEKIQQSTKTWADLLKDTKKKDDVVVSQALEEQAKRDYKALNIRVRGAPTDIEPMQAATELLSSLSFEETDIPVETAWRGKHDPSVIFVRFKYTDHRDDVLRRRGRLKGSNVFVYEDLTALQWSERKKLIEEANAKGQKVFFRDGRHFFVASTAHALNQPPA